MSDALPLQHLILEVAARGIRYSSLLVYRLHSQSIPDVFTTESKSYVYPPFTSACNRAKDRHYFRLSTASSSPPFHQHHPLQPPPTTASPPAD